MKNKFNNALEILSILIAFSFLNSCNGKNGFHTDDSHNMKETLSIQEKAKACLCPICREGSRYLYELSTPSHDLVLYCEECEAVWTDPKKMFWNQSATDKSLESEFKVENIESIFDEEKSKWATRKEIELSKWKCVTKGGQIFIK